MGGERAPRGVVSLCARLLGSNVGSRAGSNQGTLETLRRLESGLSRRDALRVAELRLALEQSDLRRPDSLFLLVDELRGEDDGVDFRAKNNRYHHHAEEQEEEERRPSDAAPRAIVASHARTELKTRELRPEKSKYAHMPEKEQMEEELLVRDVLYAFQGINGRYVRYEPRSGSYVVDRAVSGKLSRLDAVRELCEVGWLFTRVRTAAKPAVNPDNGRVDSALRAVLFDELTDFYRELAVLEAQHSRGSNGPPLTLRKLLAWSERASERLQVLANVAEAAVLSPPPLRGGALLSVLEAHSKHGDAKVKKLVLKLLARAAVPIFAFLRRWIEHGELDDSHGEFFVALQQQQDTWTSRYRLRRSMLPDFIDEETAAKILLIGKTINFLRHSCGEDNVITNASSSEDAFRYHNSTNKPLKLVVDRVLSQTSFALREAVFVKFKLLEHLSTLKATLLMAKGDFVVCLLDSLAPKLAAPALSVYKHDLSGAFEAALRASMTTFTTTLDCLRVAVLAPSREEDSSGWDVFGLDYEPPSPVDVVVDAKSMDFYRRANRCLWRHKRLEWLASRAWRVLVTARKTPGLSRSVRAALHAASLTRSRLAQLTTTLSSHYASVTEEAWSRLLTTLDKNESLDSVIAAHEAYLEEIFANAPFENPALSTELAAVLGSVRRFCFLLDSFVADSYTNNDPLTATPTTTAPLRRASAEFDTAAHSFKAALALAATDNMALQRLHFNLNF